MKCQSHEEGDNPFSYDHLLNFAWNTEDMLGFSPDIAEHRLNIDSTFKPIKQKLRKFRIDKIKGIQVEV